MDIYTTTTDHVNPSGHSKNKRCRANSIRNQLRAAYFRVLYRKKSNSGRGPILALNDPPPLFQIEMMQLQKSIKIGNFSSNGEIKSIPARTIN